MGGGREGGRWVRGWSGLTRGGTLSKNIGSNEVKSGTFFVRCKGTTQPSQNMFCSADTEGVKDIKIKAFSSGRRAVKRSHSWRYTDFGTLAP